MYCLIAYTALSPVLRHRLYCLTACTAWSPVLPCHLQKRLAKEAREKQRLEKLAEKVRGHLFLFCCVLLRCCMQ
jgi:hypothetical protein